MSDFLDAACAAARERVDGDRERIPLDELQATACRTTAPPGFVAALVMQSPDVAVIGEIKRASPSRGPLAPIPDAACMAARYEAGGAAAVSVLTEPRSLLAARWTISKP